jgi:hypothetical protein
MQPKDQDPLKPQRSFHDIIRDNEERRVLEEERRVLEEERRVLEAKRRKAEWALEAERRYYQAIDELINHNTDYVRRWIKRNKKRIIRDVIENNQSKYGQGGYNRKYRLS